MTTTHGCISATPAGLFLGRAGAWPGAGIPFALPQRLEPTVWNRQNISGTLTMFDVSCPSVCLAQRCTLLATYKCTLSALRLTFGTTIRRRATGKLGDC
jgi:hypothetical protein